MGIVFRVVLLWCVMKVVATVTETASDSGSSSGGNLSTGTEVGILITVLASVSILSIFVIGWLSPRFRNKATSVKTVSKAAFLPTMSRVS